MINACARILGCFYAGGQSEVKRCIAPCAAAFAYFTRVIAKPSCPLEPAFWMIEVSRPGLAASNKVGVVPTETTVGARDVALPPEAEAETKLTD